ncbi:MAG: zinc ribbon domain-containing protein [Leptolyngbyaceae cyanobacterium MO_188.B28]|nr:zinc ribbon domain-containing protein [Leptolyngbyaceae cyanobacterium MO_188.B28]
MSKNFTCPNCGADVPVKARACPECGSDEETGWSDAAQYIHLLPTTADSEIDASPAKIWRKSFTAAIALFLVVTFLSLQGLTWAMYALPFIVLIGGIIYFANKGAALGNWGSLGHWGMERRLYQQLLSRTRRDRKLAQRLIEYERRRNPESNKLQLLQNAIYRWDRDRKI